MARSHIMAATLIVALTVTSAHSLTLPSASRKGAIDSAYVQPTNPTTVGVVTLHVSVKDYLLLDRFDIRQIGKTFTVRVYWNEPPAGTTTSGPTNKGTSLGTLSEGKYRVLIQSYCERRLAGTAQASFEVKAAGAAGPIDTIDEVWMTPEAPTTSDAATVHVSGHWPTAGYSRHVALTRLSGQTVTVDLYWSSPEGPVAFVITPYDYEAPLSLVHTGTYTVQVRIFLDGTLADSAQIAVQVAPGSNDGWSWDLWNWDLGF